jgi:hypothetical protein
VEKSSPKNCATPVIFEKLPKRKHTVQYVKICPISKNLPNQVTLAGRGSFSTKKMGPDTLSESTFSVVKKRLDNFKVKT